MKSRFAVLASIVLLLSFVLSACTPKLPESASLQDGMNRYVWSRSSGQITDLRTDVTGRGKSPWSWEKEIICFKIHWEDQTTGRTVTDHGVAIRTGNHWSMLGIPEQSWWDSYACPGHY